MRDRQTTTRCCGCALPRILQAAFHHIRLRNQMTANTCITNPHIAMHVRSISAVQLTVTGVVDEVAEPRVPQDVSVLKGLSTTEVPSSANLLAMPLRLCCWSTTTECTQHRWPAGSWLLIVAWVKELPLLQVPQAYLGMSVTACQ